MDASKSMLVVACDKLGGLRLHHADMRDFDIGQRFDVVACLFSGIG
jgi:hypothetical protein